jgi:PLP dependent protein
MSDVQANITKLQNRIYTACDRTGRQRDEVQLLLATKTVAPDKILAALRNGETLIGENKVQELKDKYALLQSVPHTTHFIGHLQTNKVKDVLKYADCIQSVDRIDLAEKLQKRLEAEDKTIDVFLQVNTSNEESKFGIAPGDASEFSKQVQKLDRLNIKGLMTIGLFSADGEKVRACFKLLKQIQIELLEQGVSVNELSMGMSNDLEIAIEEGATIIRVGTAIFGERQYPDSYYWNEKKHI